MLSYNPVSQDLLKLLMVCAYCKIEMTLKVEGIHANYRLTRQSDYVHLESVFTHVLRSENNIFSCLSFFEGCIPTKTKPGNRFYTTSS